MLSEAAQAYLNAMRQFAELQRKTPTCACLDGWQDGLEALAEKCPASERPLAEYLAQIEAGMNPRIEIIVYYKKTGPFEVISTVDALTGAPLDRLIKWMKNGPADLPGAIVVVKEYRFDTDHTEGDCTCSG